MSRFFDSFIIKVKNSPIAHDSFWALFGSALGKGLSLLAGILVARFLGKDIYGQYGILKNTLMNIAIFSTLGLGYTGTRFISQGLSSNPNSIHYIIKTVFRITLVASSIMAFFVFLFSQQIAVFIKAPSLYHELRLTAIIIVFNAVNTSQIGVLSGFKAFRTIARNNIISGIVTFILSGVLAYHWLLMGALWALLLSTVFNVAINSYSVQQFDDQTGQNSSSTVTTKDIVLFSVPIALQESMYTLVSFTSAYLLILYGGYGELGISSAAAQWSGVLLFLPGVLKNIMLSYFSSSDSTAGLRKKLLLINGVATFFPWVIISLLAGFISSFYGQSYSNLPIVLVIACSSAIFSSVSSVIVYEFISLGKNWEMFFCRLIRDGLSLLLMWLLFVHIKTIPASVISVSVTSFISCLFMIVLLVLSNRISNLSSKESGHI